MDYSLQNKKFMDDIQNKNPYKKVSMTWITSIKLLH